MSSESESIEVNDNLSVSSMSTSSCSSTGTEEDLNRSANGGRRRSSFRLVRCIVCKRPQLRSHYNCTEMHFACIACLNLIKSGQSSQYMLSTCSKCSLYIPILIDSDLSEVREQCDCCAEDVQLSDLENHAISCMMRPSLCCYTIMGCTWEGPLKQLADHEKICEFKNMTGAQVNEQLTKRNKAEALKFFSKEYFSSGKTSLRRVLHIKLGRDDIRPEIPFFGGIFEADSHKWIVELLWKKKNEAYNGQSTISYNLQLNTHNLLEDDHSVKVHHFLVKGPYGDANCITNVNVMEFSSEETISADSVIYADSVEKCEQFIQSKDKFLRFYFGSDPTPEYSECEGHFN